MSKQERLERLVALCAECWFRPYCAKAECFEKNLAVIPVLARAA